ncbi:hypothetical protein ACF09C_11570 [Streptomyces sp. NPDC014870]|uniref:hypothetical protein n=1 Tax=Streptomyces sp. NPDC014870 TaxID=3364925 RepID=UPI0036FD2758
MSPWASWTLLATGAVFVLVPSVALLRGWRPGGLWWSEGPVSLLGSAGVALYGVVLAGEVPRLAGTSADVRAACAYTALGLVALATALVVLYDHLAQPSRSKRR